MEKEDHLTGYKNIVFDNVENEAAAKLILKEADYLSSEEIESKYKELNSQKNRYLIFAIIECFIGGHIFGFLAIIMSISLETMIKRKYYYKALSNAKWIRILLIVGLICIIFTWVLCIGSIAYIFIKG